MEWPPDWVMVTSGLCLGFYVFITWHHDYFKKRKLPFVRPKPFVGNLGPLVFRKESFGDILMGLYTKFKGHGVAGYFELMSRVVLILDPEIIRLIVVKDFDHFTDHRSLVREDNDPLWGKSLFGLQGQRWKDMRHTLSPAFTSSKMKAMFLLVQKTGTQLGDYLESKCREDEDGLLTLELKDLFTRFATDVIATAAFGLQCDSLVDPNNEFHRVGTDVTDFTGLNGFRLLGFFFSPKLMKLLNIKIISKYNANYFRSLVHGNMETRERENIVRPDMIHLLMQAKKGTLKSEITDEATAGVSEEQGGKKLELSDDDLTAQAVFFFMAGFDTSSTLLCFMSHLLAVHPDIQRRVQQEMDEVLQESDGELTYEGVQRMKYLDCVISETLRLYPPAMSMDRQCSKWFVIPPTSSSPPVFIRKGDYVSIPTIAIHRDPEFFPNPMKFDPERFSDENKHNIRPFTYLPFGLGPRACIGMRFALMEAKIAMTSLLTRFDLEVVAKTSVPLVLSKSSFINLSVEGGFWVGIRPRSNRS